MARGDVYSHQRKTISIVSNNIIDGDAIDQLYLQVTDMMSGGGCSGNKSLISREKWRGNRFGQEGLGFNYVIDEDDGNE